MARLRWTRDRPWLDAEEGVEAYGSGVYDVPDDAVDDYLAHPIFGWEAVEDDEAGDADPPTCAGTTADGDSCSNTVDAPGEFCHLHGPDEE